MPAVLHRRHLPRESHPGSGVRRTASGFERRRPQYWQSLPPQVPMYNGAKQHDPIA